MDAFNITATRQNWETIVRQVIDRNNARGIPRPDGMVGRYSVWRKKHNEWTRYTLAFRPSRSDRWIYVGYWSVWNDHPVRNHRIAPVPVGRIVELDCGRRVRVAVDERGLPYPVPVFES